MSVDPRAFAQEWVEAWNSHDLDRILSHYDDAAELTSPRARAFFGKADGTVRGKAELRAYFGGALARLPDLHFELERVFSGVESIIVEFHTKDGRHGAEHMTIGADGRVRRAMAHYAE